MAATADPETLLAASEARYHALLDNIPLPTFIYDTETLRYLAVNQAALNLYGYSRDEFLAMRVTDIRPEDDVPLLLEIMETLDRRPRKLGVWRHRTRSGALLWMDIISQDTEEAGRRARLIIATDVTERLRAERALAETREKLSEAQGIARIGSWEWDPSTGEVTWSPELQRMLGIARDASPSFDLWLPMLSADGRARLRAALDAVREHGACEAELRFQLPSGELEAQALAEVREVGGARRVLGTLQDVTAQRRLERAMRESEENFRIAFQTVPDAMSIGRLEDGVNIAVNENYCRMSGWSQAEAVGATSIQLDIWVDPEQRQAAFDALREQGYVRELEVRFRRKDKSQFDATLSSRIYSIGSKRYFLTVTRDITERKRAARAQEAVYRIADAANATGTLQQLLGFIHHVVSEQMPAPNFYIALHAGDALEFPYYVDERGDIPIGPQALGRGVTEYVLRTGQPLALTDRAQFHSLVLRGEVEQVGEPALCWIGVPLRTQDRTVGVLAAQIYSGDFRYDARHVELLQFVSSQVARAIERKQGLDALRDSEQRFRALIGNSSDGIMVLAADGVVIFSSAAVERILGPGAGAPGANAFELIHPEDRARVLREFSAALARPGVPMTITGRARHRDGSWRELESVIVNRLDDPAVRGVVRNFRDVTDRKQMEARLMMADRMVSVGTLAAGVAHEINNPLAYVMANLEYARGRAAGADQEAFEALAEAQTGAERVRDIVRDLKTFSRGDDLKQGPVDLQRVLEASANMAWNEVRHRARLFKDYAADLPKVLGNESRLGQVFLNLLINAAQAIPEGAAERNQIRLSTRALDDGRVLVSVQDSGAGISAEHVSRLFDPFFTTKPIGVGTGLGLFICQNIVSALGGEITVDSAPGRGTTMQVALRVASPSSPPPPVSRRDAPAAARGRLLVIDDEPLIGAALVRSLPAHDVAVETSALAALARLRSGETFDLILCDVMMPDLTGVAFHEQLSKDFPALAKLVVFMTGGAFTPSARDFLDRIPNPRLEKPLHLPSLLALLSERLTPPK
jgi:PAS domain S-box-containing protein